VVWSDGTIRWLRETGNVVKNDRDETIKMMGVVRDITEEKASANYLKYLAHYDPLTGLPNRLVLEERLSEALELARTSATSAPALASRCFPITHRASTACCTLPTWRCMRPSAAGTISIGWAPRAWCGHIANNASAAGAHREQARSHSDLCCTQYLRTTKKHCGSEPAREGGGTTAWM